MIEFSLSVYLCVSCLFVFLWKTNKQTNKQKKNKQGSIFPSRLSKPQW